MHMNYSCISFFLKIEITTTPSLGKYKNSCIVSGAQLLVKFAKLSGTWGGSIHCRQDFVDSVLCNALYCIDLGDADYIHRECHLFGQTVLPVAAVKVVALSFQKLWHAQDRYWLYNISLSTEVYNSSCNVIMVFPSLLGLLGSWSEMMTHREPPQHWLKQPCVCTWQTELGVW